MSYASVAAHDAPSLSEQPQPDPSLLNTTSTTADPVADDSAKVNIVPSDFKHNPATVTSVTNVQPERDEQRDSSTKPSRGPSQSKKHGNKALSEAKDESIYFMDLARNLLFRPGVAGGLLGVVNVGLAIAASRSFYTSPHLRRDRAAISSTLAAALAIIGVEGYIVERYRQTPRGQEEERQAKEKGTLIYRHLREYVLRPGVLGGLVGLVNTSLIGVLGYYSYIHWDKPSWDRRVTSAASVGFLLLWASEGAVAKQYRAKR